MDVATQDLSVRRTPPDRAIPTTVTTGWWACDLVTEALTWSDGVYDLFDFPRASVLDRAETAARYTPVSRIALECLRVAAIRDKTGFTLDAELDLGTGRRWVRIVAQVECVDGKAMRLFGTKSDVTHEKLGGLRSDFQRTAMGCARKV
ncbi:hypothetical protein [Sphingomonas sp. PAMC 26605]|uniref:hypothetical protein n=1 Tax=Sphingomonas sp. PAMC 26605 TaxID=1112214 RepID=UPI0012F51599|nr:hypothetical protein [Sphingomonas sp. PAMC 26605]